MTNNPTDDSRPWSVFLIFLRLGLTSFGGPIAHLGYFRAEFVTRRRWLSERSYADLVGHCCKVSDEAAFCLIQRPYISKTLLTRRISPRGSP